MAKRKSKETCFVEKVFSTHFPDCPPEYPPQAYRYNSVSMRLRIVNKRFKGMNRSKRFDLVEPIIDTLPENTQSDLLLVLLLAPEEVDHSAGNYEFEHPSPAPRLNHRKAAAKR